MVYFKGFMAGLAALFLCAALFEAVLLTLSLIQLPPGVRWDERTIVPHFWSISLPVAVAAFAVGFFWRLRRGAKFRSTHI